MHTLHDPCSSYDKLNRKMTPSNQSNVPITITHLHKVDVPAKPHGFALECSFQVNLTHLSGGVLDPSQIARARQLTTLVAGYLHEAIKIGFSPSRLADDVDWIFNQKTEESTDQTTVDTASLGAAFTGRP